MVPLTFGGCKRLTQGAQALGGAVTGLHQPRRGAKAAATEKGAPVERPSAG